MSVRCSLRINVAFIFFFRTKIFVHRSSDLSPRFSTANSRIFALLWMVSSEDAITFAILWIIPWTTLTRSHELWNIFLSDTNFCIVKVLLKGGLSHTTRQRVTVRSIFGLQHMRVSIGILSFFYNDIMKAINITPVLKYPSFLHKSKRLRELVCVCVEIRVRRRCHFLIFFYSYTLLIVVGVRVQKFTW